MASRVEVSGERLAGNYRAAKAVLEREAAPTGRGAAVLAVVKADAYGHGAGLCAAVLARAGAPWLGVTDAAEGAAVRAALMAAGLRAEVLVMCGHLASDAGRIVGEGLTAVVWTRGQMEGLAAVAGGGPVGVHLEVDTGMSRQGVRVGELAGLLGWMAGEPRVRLEGVMTHFASAEVAGSAQTGEQRAAFEEALRLVAAAGFRPAWVHAGNTSALDNGADGGGLRWLARLAEGAGARAMVRAGLGLYGYCLPVTRLVGSDGDAVRLRGAVRPAMRWVTQVLSVSEVAAGARVGYNGSYMAERAMRLALLPVGYADGLRRELSSTRDRAGGWVMVRGRRAAVVGRVSMNLVSVDVTDVEGVTVGDEAVLLGDGVTAEDHAAWAGTIAYEVLCGVRGERVLV